MNEALKKAVTKAAVYKGYIVALVIAIALILIYLQREKIIAALGMQPLNGTSGDNAKATAPKPSTSLPKQTDDTVLKKRMRGEKVKELQLLLNTALKRAQNRGDATAKAHQPLVTDGVFGDKTELLLQVLSGLTYSKISIARMKELMK